MSPSSVLGRPTAPPSPDLPASPPPTRAPRPVTRSTQAELRVLHAVNPFVSALLRSPLHRLVSGRLLLLTYAGRKSGRSYTIPLGYTRRGDDLLVFSSYPWTHNVQGGASVSLEVRGRRMTARAEVIEEPAAVAAEVEALMAIYGPREALARAGVKLPATQTPTREQLAQALAGVAVIRFTPDDAHGASSTPPAGSGRDTLRKALLGCGLLSSALYLVVTAIPVPGYSPLDQWVSELLAEGAPTRPPMLVLLVGGYNALVVVFAAGVWLSPGRTRLLRLTAAMLALYALLGAVTGGFFNMDMRGAVPTLRGSLHGPMTALMSIPIVLFVAFGAFLHGRRFSLYSLATLTLLVAFGLLTTRDISLLEANLPTPWMGLKERVNIYATVLWIAALARSLWLTRPAGAPQQPSQPKDMASGVPS